MSALSTCGAGGVHGYELRRTPSGVYNGPNKLPIDPTVKCILAAILAGLTIIAFASIMEAIGKRGDTRPSGDGTALTIHRINGYAFIILALVITQYCIRLLGIVGDPEEPLVAIHILGGVGIVLLPIMKLLIARRYRGLGDLLPGMGITLLILTWMTTTVILTNYFFVP
jgi:hypothetical protein